MKSLWNLSGEALHLNSTASLIISFVMSSFSLIAQGIIHADFRVTEVLGFMGGIRCKKIYMVEFPRKSEVHFKFQ